MKEVAKFLMNFVILMVCIHVVIRLALWILTSIAVRLL